ncbi:TraB/GumN family protein [Ochrobactrum sp. CM-21-5]|nr:TraB/GumN family protein [Ochrobactrum sp. CM-21-5]MBC2883882.1 TraB/GumN family protein [Ochrobactrum sp. CM-21-5]
MRTLLLLFVCALLTGPVAARAESISVCAPHGVDLLGLLKTTDLATWKQLRAAADRIPNSKGLIWKIEKDGVKPSYLFGTIHLSDPRVMKLPEAVVEAYESAGTVVIESTDVLDKKSLLALRLERPDLMLFTDGSTLKSHLPQDRQADIEQKLAERGFVLGAVAKMKPWILSSLLALPKCERERKSKGEKFLDERLAIETQNDGREVRGLETAAEQFEAMNRIPLNFHIRNLIAAIDYGDRVEDAMETTTALYLQGEIGMIMPALRKVIPDELSDEEYALFQKFLIIDRNHTMADRAQPLLEKGNIFLAVGALHLPGTEGLVELLRSKGYRVNAL